MTFQVNCLPLNVILLSLKNNKINFRQMILIVSEKKKKKNVICCSCDSSDHISE